MLLFQGEQGEECGAYSKYVSNSETASSTQKELHYPTFLPIFVVEYSGQGEIPYRR